MKLRDYATGEHGFYVFSNRVHLMKTKKIINFLYCAIFSNDFFLFYLPQPKKMDTATGSGLMEEFELMKQAKYRVYMQNIDKALKNFEYSSEWADLISALGKLNKVRSKFGKIFKSKSWQ